MTHTTPTTPSLHRRPVRNLRWWILGFALVAGIVNYMDRSALSIAAPEMIDELGITRTDIGLLGAVFSWTYAFAQLPVGWLVDKLGARRAYFLAIALWSISTALMAFGQRVGHFVVFRVLLGITEAPNSPSAARMTADWFPRTERGQATAIWDSGSKWGPAIAPPVLTAIMLAFGWRAVFGFLGVAGLVLAVAFYVWYRSPEDHRRLGEEEMAVIVAGRGTGENAVAERVSWLGLFKHRQMWGMMLGFFCIIWIWNIFITFLPLYLQDARGISIASSGWLSAVPYLGGAILGITGGRVMTKLAARPGMDPLDAKRRVMMMAAVSAGILVCLSAFVTDIALAMIVLVVAVGFIATTQAAAWSMPGDIANNSQVATVGAIQNFGGYFGGAFAPLLTGWIYDTYGTYTPSLVIGGIIAALAAVVYGTLVRTPFDTSRGAEA